MIEKTALSILLVEDEPAHAEAIRRSIQSADLATVVRVAGTLREYREIIAGTRPPDIAIIDLNLPDGSAMDVLTAPPEDNPFPIMVMTAYGDERTAVKVMKAGAMDYIVKSPDAFTDVYHSLQRTLREWNLLHERKRAEEVLRESEERYRALVDTATDAIITVDMKGRIIFGNVAASALFGYSAEEMLGRSLAMLMPEKYRREHDLGLARVVSGGEFHVIGKTIEVLGLRKDESEFPMELSLARWQTGNDLFFTGIIRNITERKQIEEKLIEAQKMDSIGNLAGGIAHDFNNMLAVMMGYSGMLLMDETNPKRKEYLESVINSGERASKLIRQLLAFGRKGKNLNQAININTLVEEVYAIIERTISKEILIEKWLSEDIHAIDGDPTQIMQIILNLCVNAKDAITEDKGMIIVQTKNVIVNDIIAKRYPDIFPGEYVMFSISDNGCGISEEVRKRIFEPFFTTKKEGAVKGAGLGLAVVYGIIRSHKGFIDLKTELGKGTTFYVYLPRGEKKYVQEKVAMQQVVQGGGTILVVDDEESIREMVNSTLSQLGYSVILAKDGEEGVAIYGERHSEIDAVVLDMRMPKMGGKEAFERMKLINPDIRAVLCTGFGQNEQSQEILDLGVKGLLTKPYRINDLSQVIAQILAK